MKRTATLLLFLLAVVVCPAGSFGQIQEVADDDGNITHYKYTDRNGSVVFTDSLAKIPEEYRKKNKVVRVGPPKRKEPAAGQPPATETAAAPAAETLPAPQFQVKPVEPAPAEQGGMLSWLLIGGGLIGAGVVGFLVYQKMSGGGQPPRWQANGTAGPNHHAPPLPADAGREHRRPGEAAERRPDGERNHAKERPEELLKRLLQTRDYAGAARLCESQGDLAKAAGYHLESENAARAHELYLGLKDYRRAAELSEKAGDDLKAAELYEAAFQREDRETRAASGGDSALRSGRLFEKAGDLERAAAVYLKASLFAPAAAIFEARQEFLKAAETHLKAGDAERAAACFEKGGDPIKGYATLSRFSYDRGQIREAAGYAEKAGDLMQAATMFQEVGEFSRAGELFFQSGFFAEAAENFTLVNDPARAGEAHERAGNYLLAAKAFETVGIDRERLATLYEKGEDYYPAGRLFVKLGQLDRALNALQQVDPGSPNYTNASLLVGMIFLKRDLVDLAREKFLKIIDNQPVGKANLEPYYFLALCHEKTGEAEQAKSIFSKILAEDYNFRDVRKRMGG
jgi:tetratricopeptide (TPR) repeat protein